MTLGGVIIRLVMVGKDVYVSNKTMTCCFYNCCRQMILNDAQLQNTVTVHANPKNSVQMSMRFGFHWHHESNIEYFNTYETSCIHFHIRYHHPLHKKENDMFYASFVPNVFQQMQGFARTMNKWVAQVHGSRGLDQKTIILCMSDCHCLSS